MTRLISILFILCLSLSAVARAGTVENQTGSDAAPASAAGDKAGDIVAESEIKAVTVYSNRAKITRKAVVDVPAGAHAVVFSHLPAMLLPDSLRAEGTAAADVKIGAVAAKEIMSSQLASPRENELNMKLEALQDQMTLINAEKTAIDAEGKFLANLGQQASLRANENLAQIDLKPDQWAGAASFIHSGLAEVLKNSVLQDLKIRELGRELQKTQNELAQSRTDQRSSYQVTIPLEAAQTTKLTIELSYQVPDATWKPLYDARLKSDGDGELQLIQYGAVSQRTGEDWTGVALTLSTAQPQRGASLPDLSPLWLDVYDSRAQSRGAAKSLAMDSFQAGNAGQNMQQASNMVQNMPGQAGGAAPAAPGEVPAEALREEKKQAQFVTADINSGGFVSEYNIPGPGAVPADGTETRLMVGTFSTDSKLEVHIKPQLSTEAFLVVKCKLKGDAPILPGQVNLFRDGAYVGQSMLPLLRPSEEHGLYFGVDDQVSVKRKVLKDERKETGVITHDNVLERDVVTELQNLHNRAVDVVVKETAPVARNEKIHVEILKDAATTPGYEEDAANIKGLLSWSFKMEPKEKKSLKLGWTVTWPTDETLSGL